LELVLFWNFNSIYSFNLKNI